MSLRCRLIVRLLFALLLTVAAPFSMAGERPAEPWAQEGVTALIVVAGTPTPAVDIGFDDPHAPALEDAGNSEPLESDVDAQECALPCSTASVNAAAVTAPIAFLSPPVPSPALAALDRPPRGF